LSIDKVALGGDGYSQPKTRRKTQEFVETKPTTKVVGIPLQNWECRIFTKKSACDKDFDY
jgi:hypothetical protein